MNNLSRREFLRGGGATLATTAAAIAVTTPGMVWFEELMRRFAKSRTYFDLGRSRWQMIPVMNYTLTVKVNDDGLWDKILDSDMSTLAGRLNKVVELPGGVGLELFRIGHPADNKNEPRRCYLELSSGEGLKALARESGISVGGKALVSRGKPIGPLIGDLAMVLKG